MTATGRFPGLTRRDALRAAGVGGLALACNRYAPATTSNGGKKAQIAITLDLEMSRDYPRRGMREWDFQKGNLDEPTKQYALTAARTAADRGVPIHFFCVGRVLEQPDVDWLREIVRLGHPVGNHTYDHVNIWATEARQTQFRFQRAPWLIGERTAAEVIRQNIRLTTLAMADRLAVRPDGFRTPGGSRLALNGREDLQQLLLEQGFTWVSSKYPSHASGTARQPPTADVYASIVSAQAEAQPYTYPSGLIEIPMSPISDVTAFRSHYWKLEYFLKAIRLAVEWAIAQSAVFDFLAHPSCLVVEDPRQEAIRLICDLVAAADGKAEIVGLGEIARPFRR